MAVLELWSSICNNYSQFTIIVLGTFIVHEFFWLIFNLPYMIFDDFHLLQQYKLQDSSKVTSAIRWTTFKDLLKGHILQLLPVTIIGYPLLKWIGFTASSTLPTFKIFAIQFIVFNVIEDTGFYWVHRLMHKPSWYKAYHYKHHEYTAPFSLTGEVAHPVEFLFNFLIPMMLGPLLMAYIQGVHVLTFWCWLGFRALRSTDAHSGFNFPFHPLRLIGSIYGGAEYHGFHHMYKGMSSNFGGYKFWEYLMGTNEGFTKRKAKGKTK
eukprot:TRINITY_DN486_c0_g2_i4.p1 TRINITY_DN486_c0_g2~~TRINITY_DN486_c0_g2_i4.p1  ORF type:complete len:291 (-),score=38.18 TRINITY_DN486_c0_g2_i4:144-938(-)